MVLHDQQREFEDFLKSVCGPKTNLRRLKADMIRQLKQNADYIDRATADTERICLGTNSEPLKHKLEPVVSSGRSAAFVCPHWGNYVKTFIEIAAACSDGTKFLTFRGYRWNDQEEQFWKALNTVTARTIGIMRVFEVSSFIKEVRKLKSGHHLFVLCDLFSDFGNTQPVQVFGKCLHLASGWVRVCYIANSIVILVAPISRDRDHLQIIDVIDPRHSPSLDHFMHQCMHSVQWSLEHLIAENPGYWFMWEHVEKYEAIN